MTTPARYRALRWFADHEADPLSVLLRRRPSVRMRNLMEREHQLVRIALGQFNHHRWLLTGMGEQVLAAKQRGRNDERRRRTENEVEDPKAREPRKMLSLDDVLSIVPIGRTTLFRMVKHGQFPKPTYISENRRIWYADQLIEWQDRVDNFQPERRRGRGRPRVKGALS